MSQPAPKRSVMPPVPPAAKADRTGRFTLDRTHPTVLPPPTLQAAAVLSPDELGAVLESEPAAEGSASDAGPVDRGAESGVFSKGGLQEDPDAEDPGLAQLADSLLPYYREAERKSERAELVIEDLSLRLDNPYAASSLVPPPERPKALSKRAVIGVGAALLAAAGGGALLMQLHLAATVPAQSAHRAPPRAVLTAPAHTARAAASSQDERTPAPSAAQPPPTQASVVPQAAPETAPAALVEAALPVAAQSSSAPAPARPVPPKVAAAAPSLAAPKPAGAAAAPEAPPANSGVPDLATEKPAAEAPAQLADATETGAALPETPTRGEVAAGFDAIRGALVACAQGKHGQVDIDATVANSGRVSHALIEGTFKGSPEGSCMARATRTARFPQFSRPNLKVRYALAL